MNLLSLNRHKKYNKAFSLMEATFILVVSSLIIAAVLPVVTKGAFQTPPSAVHGMYFCYYGDNGKLYEAKYSGKTVLRKMGKEKEVLNCTFNPPKNASYFEITAIGGGGAGGAGILDNKVKLSDVKTNERKFAPVDFGNTKGALTQDLLNQYRIDSNELSEKAGKLWLYARGAASGQSNIAKLKLDTTNYIYCKKDGKGAPNCSEVPSKKTETLNSSSVCTQSNCSNSCTDFYGGLHSRANGWELYWVSGNKGECRAKIWQNGSWGTDYTCLYCGTSTVTNNSINNCSVVPIVHDTRTDSKKFSEYTEYQGLNSDCNSISYTGCDTADDIINDNCKPKESVSSCNKTFYKSKQTSYINANSDINVLKIEGQINCPNGYIKVPEPYTLSIVRGNPKNQKEPYYSSHGAPGVLCYSKATTLKPGLKIDAETKFPITYTASTAEKGAEAKADTKVSLKDTKNTKVLAVTANRSTPGSSTLEEKGGNFDYIHGKPGVCVSDLDPNDTVPNCLDANDMSPYGYCYSKDGKLAEKNGLLEYFSVQTKANFYAGKSGLPGEIKTIVVRSLADKDIDIHVGRGGNKGNQDGGSGSATYIGTKGSEIVYAKGGAGGKGNLSDKRSYVILPVYDGKNKQNQKFSMEDCNIYKGNLCSAKQDNSIDSILEMIKNVDSNKYEIVKTAGYSGIGSRVVYNDSSCLAGQYLSFVNDKLMLNKSVFLYPEGSTNDNSDIANKLNLQLQKLLRLNPGITSSDIAKIKKENRIVPRKCTDSTDKDYKTPLVSASDGKDGMLIIRW